MATVRQMLRMQSKLHNVQFWVIERDYALSYLLKAISTTEGFGDTLAKGTIEAAEVVGEGAKALLGNFVEKQ